MKERELKRIERLEGGKREMRDGRRKGGRGEMKREERKRERDQKKGRREKEGDEGWKVEGRER